MIISDLDSDNIITNNTPSFIQEIKSKTDDAAEEYDPPIKAERRAYDDGKSSYQYLADSIKP